MFEIYIEATTANQAGGGIGTSLLTRKKNNALDVSAPHLSRAIGRFAIDWFDEPGSVLAFIIDTCRVCV
ncbi:hypothetical protein [Bradyrhizobium sp. F1.13.3]|uniref:hypothetical protein n=1 Tax=Bradyrhizobium sp. F1.13.3 TaxID=3156351 RepID=UPI0033964A32